MSFFVDVTYILDSGVGHANSSPRSACLCDSGVYPEANSSFDESRRNYVQLDKAKNAANNGQLLTHFHFAHIQLEMHIQFDALHISKAGYPSLLRALESYVT